MPFPTRTSMADTTSNTNPHDFASLSLPQYGFGTECEFDVLVKNAQFLFRVYTPKPRSPFSDPSDPFFVGQKFDDRYTQVPTDLFESRSSPPKISQIASYADVIHHMDWTTRYSSPYITTSFSFMWAIWEALRRYHEQVKHDVEIAIIDARAVADKAMTTVQLLRQALPKERHHDHWRWYHSAQESQAVLVHGFIPGSAVLASIPLLSIIQKLPSYFLQENIHNSKPTPLTRLAWDFTQKKPSYRQFCQAMSERFLCLSVEERLHDTTVGSVRLALTFLRPWFQHAILEHAQEASVTVSALALAIAQWPARWWMQDHAENWDIITDIVRVLVEELQHQKNTEIARLEAVVDELEHVVSDYEWSLLTRSNDTGQDEPRQSGDVVLSSAASSTAADSAPPSVTSSPSRKVHLSLPSAPSEVPCADVFHSLSPVLPTDFIRSLSCFSQPDNEKSSPSASPPPSPTTSSSSSAETETYDDHDHLPDAQIAYHPTRDLQTGLRRAYPVTVAETASCIVTGFLVGVLITLCILSPQRRTLLTHLT